MQFYNVISEIKKLIKMYKREKQDLIERGIKYTNERQYYEEKLIKIKKLRSYLLDDDVNLVNEIKFYKILSKILLGLFIILMGFIFFSSCSILSIAKETFVSFGFLKEHVLALIIEIVSMITTFKGLGKVEKIHNTYCDAYYLLDELCGDEIYDIFRINDLNQHYLEKRDNAIIQKLKNEEKIEEIATKIEQLELLFNKIIEYTSKHYDMLDEIVLSIVNENTTGELKEELSKKLVKK